MSEVLNMELGTGTVISFSSGFFGGVRDISPPNSTRPSIKTSHMTTPGHDTFILGKLVDWGEARIELGFKPGVRPPIDDAASACVITFPSGQTWSFSAFLTDAEPAVPLEDLMIMTCTIKVTGDVTIAAGGGS